MKKMLPFIMALAFAATLVANFAFASSRDGTASTLQSIAATTGALIAPGTMNPAIAAVIHHPDGSGAIASEVQPLNQREWEIVKVDMTRSEVVPLRNEKISAASDNTAVVIAYTAISPIREVIHPRVWMMTGEHNLFGGNAKAPGAIA